jgi:hypothetical protein
MPYGDIKRLNSATAQLAATTSTLYTAPSGKRTQVASILATSTATNFVTLELFDNGSTTANRLLLVCIAANDTYEFAPKIPLVLQGGETIQGKASVASTVNIKLLGREET